MPGEMFELDLKEVKNNRKSRKIQNVSRQAKSKVKPKKSSINFKYNQNYTNFLKYKYLFLDIKFKKNIYFLMLN
jgi:hypothetical protein